VSFLEAIQDWWDSRDLRKIRRRRQKKADQYLRSIKQKEINGKELSDDENSEGRIIAKADEDLSQDSKVISLKKKISLKGHFFATSFEKGYRWTVFIILGILLIIGFLLIVIFSSNMFAISEIEYRYSESTFINDSLLDIYTEKYQGENVFLVNLDLIKDDLLNNFQTVSNVQVDKLYPKTLLITILEYRPAVILRIGQSEQDEYLINQAGMVVATRPYSGVNADYVTVLTTNADFEAAVGDQVMDKNQVDFFYKAESLFEDKVGILVVSIWWLEREQEVHMWTQKYFKIIMSLNRPVEDQIDEMIIALQDLELKRRNFEYIDLRIQDKIFVKPR
jgi:cell division septal protein FtsQ